MSAAEIITAAQVFEPQRLDVRGAARLLGVSVSWLRKQTAAGKCPAVVRHGHRVTYDRDLLLSWNRG